MRPSRAISILNTKTLEPEDAVTVGMQLDGRDVWNKVAEVINWSCLKNPKIMELGYQANNDYFWGLIETKLHKKVQIIIVTR